jgi:hypothetical protein
MTMNDFEDFELDDKYLVEYILMDDFGFVPKYFHFLIPVGTKFEHEYGTYEVFSIDKNSENRIMVICNRLESKKPMYDCLLSMRNQFN